MTPRERPYTEIYAPRPWGGIQALMSGLVADLPQSPHRVARMLPFHSGTKAPLALFYGYGEAVDTVPDTRKV